MDTSNPFNYSTTIDCYLEYEIRDESTNLYSATVSATWMNTHLISCLIPSSVAAYQDINISVTFDDSVIFSNKLILTMIETPTVTNIDVTQVYPTQFVN